MTPLDNAAGFLLLVTLPIAAAFTVVWLEGHLLARRWDADVERAKREAGRGGEAS